MRGLQVWSEGRKRRVGAGCIEGFAVRCQGWKARKGGGGGGSSEMGVLDDRRACFVAGGGGGEGILNFQYHQNRIS